MKTTLRQNLSIILIISVYLAIVCLKNCDIEIPNVRGRFITKFHPYYAKAKLYFCRPDLSNSWRNFQTWRPHTWRIGRIVPMNKTKTSEGAKVLFLSDSRGTGIDTSLHEREDLSDIDIVFKIWRGASYRNFEDFLLEENSVNYALTIVCGGICDFTRKERIQHKGENYSILTYKEEYNSVNLIIPRLTNIRNRLREGVIFATIPPASIVKYANIINKSQIPTELTAKFLEDQNRLINDIKKVNEWIINDSKDHQLPLIDWHRPLFPSKTKKRDSNGQTKRIEKFYDNHLVDGVHGDEWIKSKWFKRVFDIIPTYIRNKLDSSTTQSESETETWNFKRLRRDDSDEEGPSPGIKSVIVVPRY